MTQQIAKVAKRAFLNLPTTAKWTSKLGRMGLVFQKYSPEILLTVGLGSMVVGTVLACKSVKDGEFIIDCHNGNIERERQNYEAELKEDENHPYTKSEPHKICVNKRHGREVFNIYKDTGVELIKIYGPAVTTYVFGGLCVCASFGIMKQRNVALMAAYTTLETAYNKYRERVKTVFGEDVEREIYEGRAIKYDKYDDKGKKVETVEMAADENSKDLAPYIVYWDRSTSASFRENADYAYSFLHGIERNMNDKLLTQGHLVLNDVYDALGLDHTATGAICGWIIEDNGPDEIDWEHIIKFDIKEEHYTDWDTVNVGCRTGRNPTQYRIDFNCDGIIWDKIGVNKAY